MNVLETLSVKRFKRGYELRTEMWSMGTGDEPTEMISAYTPSGDYIGNQREAHRLVSKRGVQPEKVSQEHCVCSIGYSVKDGKWYGWSHRAIFGFKVGSVCKKGHCHYRPKNKKDFREDMKRFWSDPGHDNVKASYGVCDGLEGVWTHWTFSDDIPNEKARGTTSGSFSPYPEEFGKGEWTAKTTADAKQMAIDFAAGVS